MSEQTASTGGAYTIPYTPSPNAWPPLQPYVSGTLLTTTLSLAEKAEIVLALLLANVGEDRWVELCTAPSDEKVALSEAGGVMYVQVAPDATFDEIIEFLYDTLGSPRGRALR